MSQVSTAPPANPATAGEQTPCPRCKKPLIDPSGLGWCKACGYCHSLADTDIKSLINARPVQKAPVTVPGAPPAPSVSGIARHWVWAMLLGIVLIAGATYAGGRLLQLTPLERALLTSVQIGAGLLIMFVAQFIGLIRIAAEESALTFWDAVFPFRLYGLVLKRLPATRLTLYGGSWGLTAILAAAICIGGLQHWFNYLPGNQKNRTNQVQRGR